MIPFGGSTRLGSMPVTEAVVTPHLSSTLVIASAGNDGLDTTMYPAVDPDTIGVAAWSKKATDLGWLKEACSAVSPPARGLGLRSLAYWSNKGIAAQLAAPGVAVPAPFVSATLKIKSGSLDRPEGVKAQRFTGWGLFTGTSFSAAVAAGCLAGEVGGAKPPTPDTLAAALAR